MTYVVASVWFIFSINPSDGSTLVYICADVTPTTTTNQLVGLDGKTPVRIPFYGGNNNIKVCVPPNKHFAIRLKYDGGTVPGL